MSLTIIMALIGALGIGAQWLAWRLQMPAIVLMLAAGLIAGPALGLIDPGASFGALYQPVIGASVAMILFEGGLTLNFREIRGTLPAVRRLVFPGAPLAWLLSSLAAYYGGGLSIASSIVLGGILIVTGPTVVIPLLRQARLAQRPASVLRWEAIINDAVGALAAVLAFEVIASILGKGTLAEAGLHLLTGIAVALVMGYAAARGIEWSFLRGHVPEFLKVPVLFAVVLLVYALSDEVLHESGLLAVTLMGVVLANTALPSLGELHRFKEHVTVLLVSGTFILLAASLDVETLALLDWRALAFVLLIMLVARPLAVILSLARTDLPMSERAFIGWIGPRGIVAVAVAGLFGARLTEVGIEDGRLLAPYAFALVAATVLAHGFSIKPLARFLGLTSRSPAGVILVGASPLSIALGQTLSRADIPVLIADDNYSRLRAARQAQLPNYHGEILSEAAEHSIAMSRYGLLVAATENDAYNALICTDFGPEFGRSNVFQIGRHEAEEGERHLPASLGGRTLGDGASFDLLLARLAQGWNFALTPLTEQYDLEAYRADRPGVAILGVVSASGTLALVSGDKISAGPGDQILGLRKSKKQEPS